MPVRWVKNRKAAGWQRLPAAPLEGRGRLAGLVPGHERRELDGAGDGGEQRVGDRLVAAERVLQKSRRHQHDSRARQKRCRGGNHLGHRT
jgi:hypothetical protein